MSEGLLGAVLQWMKKWSPRMHAASALLSAALGVLFFFNAIYEFRPILFEYPRVWQFVAGWLLMSCGWGAFKARVKAMFEGDETRIRELATRIETSLQIARSETDHTEVIEAHRDFDRLLQEVGLR